MMTEQKSLEDTFRQKKEDVEKLKAQTKKQLFVLNVSMMGFVVAGICAILVLVPGTMQNYLGISISPTVSVLAGVIFFAVWFLAAAVCGEIFQGCERRLEDCEVQLCHRGHEVDLIAKGRMQPCSRCGQLIDCCEGLPSWSKPIGHRFVKDTSGKRRACERCDLAENICTICNGEGHLEWIKCSSCGGSGEGEYLGQRQKCTGYSGLDEGWESYYASCDSCSGNGGRYEPCPTCNSQGWIPEKGT